MTILGGFIDVVCYSLVVLTLYHFVVYMFLLLFRVFKIVSRETVFWHIDCILYFQRR